MRASRRAMTSGLAAAALIGSAILLTSCGGSSSTSTPSPSAGIPDPCTLISAANTIAPILGSDPGTGTMNADEPAVSKVCLFSSGLVLQIEPSSRYEEAVALIVEPSTGATTQPLDGVGDEALLADYGGGINQVVARNGDFWIGVTGVISSDQATELAQSMLAAL